MRLLCLTVCAFLLSPQAMATQTFRQRHPIISKGVHAASRPLRVSWNCKPVKVAREELAWDFHEVSKGAKWVNKKLDPYSDLTGLGADIAEIVAFIMLRK